MIGPKDSVVDLTAVPSEFEAATIVEALRAHGIAAHHLGGGIAGFRAEVPGLVRIVVRATDLERAGLALRAIQAESIDIDWDEVDVGEPEEPVRESLPDASGYRCSRCGYRLDHVPAERPCPQCGAEARASREEPGPGAADEWTRRRRRRLRGLMSQTALAVAGLLLALTVPMFLVLKLAIGLTALGMVLVTIWEFLRPPPGGEDG